MIGRPPGSRDRHGKARRFDPRWDHDYRVAVARRIRDARIEQDVAVLELAAATGLSAVTIHLIERGKRTPLVSTLCRIAVALGLSPAELVP